MLIYSENTWFNSDDVDFQSLSEAKENRFVVVDLVAASLRNRATYNTSPAEMASWPIKLEEANAGGGPLLALEASYRGISEAELVTKVLDNAQQLSTLEAQIAGVSGMHRDVISSLTTIEEVCAYDMRSGWPEV